MKLWNNNNIVSVHIFPNTEVVNLHMQCCSADEPRSWCEVIFRCREQELLNCTEVLLSSSRKCWHNWIRVEWGPEKVDERDDLLTLLIWYRRKSETIYKFRKIIRVLNNNHIVTIHIFQSKVEVNLHGQRCSVDEPEFWCDVIFSSAELQLLNCIEVLLFLSRKFRKNRIYIDWCPEMVDKRGDSLILLIWHCCKSETIW